MRSGASTPPWRVSRAGIAPSVSKVMVDRVTPSRRFRGSGRRDRRLWQARPAAGLLLLGLPSGHRRSSCAPSRRRPAHPLRPRPPLSELMRVDLSHRPPRLGKDAKARLLMSQPMAAAVVQRGADEVSSRPVIGGRALWRLRPDIRVCSGNDRGRCAEGAYHVDSAAAQFLRAGSGRRPQEGAISHRSGASRPSAPALA